MCFLLDFLLQGFLIFPIAGAVIGYELSQPDFVPAPQGGRDNEDGYASVHLTPVLTNTTLTTYQA